MEGWFTPTGEPAGNGPWLSSHRRCQQLLAQVVGAKPTEVVPMNSLTVNMHLLLTSFYRPQDGRTQILTIGSDFPSDQYALESHVTTRGLNPETTLLEILPRPGADTWQTDDILAAIEQHRDTLALVLMSGLHYYTGQVFDMKAIVEKVRQIGGCRLASIWRTRLGIYPFSFMTGSLILRSGIFVHEKHHGQSLPRLAGWWGYDEARRFEMTKGFIPAAGAAGWQLSTPGILTMAVHQAAIEITAEAGMENLRRKSEQLTGYLEFVIKESGLPVTIMTPAERGCQLSLLVTHRGKALFAYLSERGIMGDWREPNCIRLAPAPLYNTFEEVWQVGEAFRQYLANEVV